MENFNTENQNQTSSPIPSQTSSQILSKKEKFPVLLAIGIVIILALIALMFFLPGSRFAVFDNDIKSNQTASVGQIAQILPNPQTLQNITQTPEFQQTVQQNTRQDEAFLPPPRLEQNTTGQPANTSARNSTNNTGGSNQSCVGDACKFANPLGQSGNLETFLNKLLDVVILIGAIAVVFSIIMAGLKYVTAQGNETEIASAHKQLTWTVIGAAILLGAKVIAMVIQNTVKALS